MENGDYWYGRSIQSNHDKNMYARAVVRTQETNLKFNFYSLV